MSFLIFLNLGFFLFSLPPHPSFLCTLLMFEDKLATNLRQLFLHSHPGSFKKKSLHCFPDLSLSLQMIKRGMEKEIISEQSSKAYVCENSETIILCVNGKFHSKLKTELVLLERRRASILSPFGHVLA